MYTLRLVVHTIKTTCFDSWQSLRAVFVLATARTATEWSCRLDDGGKPRYPYEGRGGVGGGGKYTFARSNMSSPAQIPVDGSDTGYNSDNDH